MAWQTPKTNWQAADVVSKDDFNRIEGNIQELQDIKETRAGAQAKANAAAGAVQAELDAHKADGASHSKTARFVVGTSISGWTAKDCDYLCDGTDDQEEIIQALNNLPATGGEVVILDGTYNITASINIPKDNVSIRGSGNATTLKRMYNSTSSDSGPTASGLITLNEKSGCKIQGLQIDGNKATYTASYNYGIHLYSSDNNTITGNTCNNNNSRGISLSSSSSDNTVTGNTCNNSNYGIYLSSSSNENTVTGNTCNNNNNYGIYLSSSSNNTVTGNTCNNNSNYGIFLSSSSDNMVTGNICNNNGSSGISLSSSSNNNTVTGNTCNNNYYGIYLSSSSNNTVTGNTCNNNYYGIYLSSSSNNTVTGNTCIRGTGQASDYTSTQQTIRLQGTNNNYNLISSNNCMGKDVVIEGGTGNTSVNKYKYGIKIINGEIYSTLFQTGEEGASDYLKLSSGHEPLLVVNGNKKALSIWATGVGGSIQFFDSSVDDMRGQILPHDDADGVGLRVQARNNHGSLMNLSLQGSNIEMDGIVWVNDDLRVFGDKDAVVPTENYGLRALSVIEMPETKFMDEGVAELINGLCRIDLDPIFLETIEPNTPETPFIVHLTPYDWLTLRVKEIGDTYFIVEEKDGLSGKFAWQLTATRKGYAGRRLDRIDDEDVLTSNWEDELNEFLEQEG